MYLTSSTEKWNAVYSSRTVVPWEASSIPPEIVTRFVSELGKQPQAVALIDYGCGNGKWLGAIDSKCLKIGVDCVDRSPLKDHTAFLVISNDLPLKPGAYGLLCIGLLHHYSPIDATQILIDLIAVVASGVLLLGYFSTNDEAFKGSGRYRSPSTGDWVYALDDRQFIEVLADEGWHTITLDSSLGEARDADGYVARMWRFVLATRGSNASMSQEVGLSRPRQARKSAVRCPLASFPTDRRSGKTALHHREGLPFRIERRSVESGRDNFKTSGHLIPTLEETL